ncbi:hypothetical protein GXB85_13540 [Cellulomonas sp. APG4]|uniref:hypothetical protein n=1 Tax=Cellulomonas sp. APG4 TaxID=1538656 RepID=UPI00137973CC|nr:hypothetical protein [Cellulomonas sp. APG4]NCT91965.1 hypothetical protein [Cellulomonas sp. APG4]
MTQVGYDELDLTTATGAWAIVAEKATTYLDLRTTRVLRQPGPDADPDRHDGCWVPLVALRDWDTTEVKLIRVGHERLAWITAPEGVEGRAQLAHVQRVVRAIRQVAPEDVPVGRPVDPDAGWRLPDRGWDELRYPED